MSSTESVDKSDAASYSVKQRDKCSNDNIDPEVHDIETILHSYREFCKRWDDIKLGNETGSRALNAYLKDIGVMDRYEQQYTPKDLMQMFETLLPIQELPPPGSDFLKYLKKKCSGDGYEYIGGDETSLEERNNLCHNIAVAKAYAVISSQRNEISNNKRKIHDLNANAVLHKLASYGDEIARLKEKERCILETSQELGLLRRYHNEKGGSMN